MDGDVKSPRKQKGRMGEGAVEIMIKELKSQPHVGGSLSLVIPV